MYLKMQDRPRDADGQARVKCAPRKKLTAIYARVSKVLG